MALILMNVDPQKRHLKDVLLWVFLLIQIVVTAVESPALRCLKLQLAKYRKLI